jgi:hypothetical protein
MKMKLVQTKDDDVFFNIVLNKFLKNFYLNEKKIKKNINNQDIIS